MKLKSFAKDLWKYLSCVCGYVRFMRGVFFCRKAVCSFAKRGLFFAKETCFLLQTEVFFCRRSNIQRATWHILLRVWICQVYADASCHESSLAKEPTQQRSLFPKQMLKLRDATTLTQFVFFCKKRPLLVKVTCVLLQTEFSCWKREVSSFAEGICLLFQKEVSFCKRDVSSFANRGLFLQRIKHPTCNMTHCMTPLKQHDISHDISHPHTKWQLAKRRALYIGGRVWLVVNREISPWLVVNREVSWFHQPRFPLMRLLMRLNLIKPHFRSVLCLASWWT